MVVEAGHVDALEVEALGDAVFDDVADPFVDARADALEAPDLRGVGQSAPVELLHTDCGDRALARCGGAVADHAAEVAGLADEPAVGLAALLPIRREGRVDEFESSSCFPGHDALGVEHDTKVLRGGESAEVDEQVVLGLEDPGDLRQTWTFDEGGGGLPAAQVDGVVGFPVASPSRAGLSGASKATPFLECLPVGDVGVAAVEADQRAHDVGGILDDGQALGF